MVHPLWLPPPTPSKTPVPALIPPRSNLPSVLVLGVRRRVSGISRRRLSTPRNSSPQLVIPDDVRGVLTSYCEPVHTTKFRGTKQATRKESGMTRRHEARTRATVHNLVAIRRVRLFLVSDAAVDQGIHVRGTRTICRDHISGSAVHANGPARFITQATGDDEQAEAFESFLHGLCVVPAPPLSAREGECPA